MIATTLTLSFAGAAMAGGKSQGIIKVNTINGATAKGLPKVFKGKNALRNATKWVAGEAVPWKGVFKKTGPLAGKWTQDGDIFDVKFNRGNAIVNQE
jgi:hypothetical protein